MNTLDLALVLKMRADTGAGGLNTLSADGIWQLNAPETITTGTPPNTTTYAPRIYTVFQELLDTPGYAFGNVVTHDSVFYQIKHCAVDDPNTAGQVVSGSMADRCRTLLTNPRQVETATVTEAVPGTLTAGNATVIVTALGMTSSPKTISVALATNDTEAVVAGKIRAALAANADVSAFFDVLGSGTSVVLTAKVYAANDTTMNISIADGTCVGLIAAPTSVNTALNVSGRVVLSCRFNRSIPAMKEYDDAGKRFIYSKGGIYEVWLA